MPKYQDLSGMDLHFGGNNSISNDAIPPDRSSSSSAPPALQLATESLFAFRVEYAKIFSDIRAHEDYYNFYESYGKGQKLLPPPLEAVPVPYLFDYQQPREEEQRLQHNYQQPDELVNEAQKHLQELQIGYGMNRSGNVEIPQQQQHHGYHNQEKGNWPYVAQPIARRAAPSMDSYSDERAHIRYPLEPLYSSSPSAQTALNTANFIWKDEDQSAQPNFSLNRNMPHQGFGQPQEKFWNGNHDEPQQHILNHQEPLSPFRNGNNNINNNHNQNHINNNHNNNFNNSFPGEDLQQQQQSQSPLLQSEKGSPGKPQGQPLEGEDGKSTACRYYAAGFCSRGDKCFYSHDPELIKEIKPAVTKAEKGQKTPGKSGKNTPRSTPTKGASQSSINSNSTPNTPNNNNNHNNNNNNGNNNGNNNNSNMNAGGSGSAPVTPPRSATSTPSLPFQTPPALSESDFTSLEALIGKIYSVSKDQQGCRFLQKKLEEHDAKATQSIFEEVYDHITELMTDPFGNYLCQKLLEFCNSDHRLMIVEKVSNDLVSISKNMHGTRAVQKLIECLTTPAQIAYVKRSLSNHVVELIQDLNGNHFIQRCLNRLSSEDNQFIYDAVTFGNHCVQVATHRHGCCVLQRCIDHASDKQKVQLINVITHNALVLVQDPYGNYVVQYVLELPFPNLVELFAKSFAGHLKQLGTQKFSSNVIEKCLSVANVTARTIMIEEILEEETLTSMLQDPFANYVVQTALTVADPKQHAALVEAIKPHLPQLRNTPYGKRIQSKILKESSGDRHGGKSRHH